MVGCGSKNRHEKDMFESDWTTFSKCVKFSRFNSQHNWGDINKKENLHFDNE